MSKTVYVVTSGSYSDYRINAVFSSEKLAEEYMKAVPNSDYNGVEEYKLDTNVPDLIRRGYSVWEVWMLRDGNTERTIHTEMDRYDIESVDNPILWERTKAPAYQGKGIPDIIRMSVWAKNEKQAVKIVNEKRVEMIANGTWK